MFDISWGEFLVLVIAGLFILGPERLPGAAAWLGRTVRQVRGYASGATDQLRSELGTDFDELRKPLQDLRELRNINPRSALTKHLLDATGGYDPREDLRLNLTPTNHTPDDIASQPTPNHQAPLGPTEPTPVDLEAT
jgi:sec-independent protein translocase protein TatB